LSSVVTTVFRMPRKPADLQVDYWKMQAEDARARADLMRDPGAKATMLESSKSTKRWPTVLLAEKAFGIVLID
jgi:hypothetical protein